MSRNTKKKEVTKEFHLPLDEAQKLFEDIRRPYDQNVALVSLNPINTSGIIMGKTNVDAQKEKLAAKGFQVIGIGDTVNSGIKEGDFVSMGTREAVQYAKKRSIIVKDVFPAKRDYTLIIVPHSFITHYVVRDQGMETEEKDVSVDLKID